MIWQKGLVERPPETHAALTVPLQISLRRCAAALDADHRRSAHEGAARSGCIMQAIDPFAGELTDLKLTCRSLRAGWVSGERRAL